MNWIDIGIIGIMLIFISIGLWKGFVISMVSMFTSSINFIISLFLVRPTTNLFNKIFGLESALTKGFTGKLSSMSSGFDTNLVGMSREEISSHVSKTLSESKFPLKGLFKSMLDITPEKIDGKASCTLNQILSKSLGSFFALIITFVVIFVLIYVVLFVISKVSKKAQEVTTIRVIDRILGFVFGLIKGAICIAFIFGILSLFSESGALSEVFTYIHASKIGDWAYTNVNYFVDKYVNFKAIAEATYKHTIMP